MTFDEIVQRTMDRLNLTSDEARARIGESVNDRYRRVTSSLGLITARRTVASGITTAGSPHVTFNGCEKLLSVYDISAGNRRVLDERTFDQWRNTQTWAPASGLPQTYAIDRMGAGRVEITLDPVPQNVVWLFGDAYENASTLADDDVPDFATDYHDILLHGALADELNKMDKAALAKLSETDYERRLSDLRMFIAKSAYLQIAQGGTAGMDRGPYWPGYRWGIWRR